MTENFLIQGYFSRETVNFVKSRALVVLIFQLNTNNLFMHQDIALRFSKFIYHVSALNGQIDFGHYTIRGLVVPPVIQRILHL